MQNNNYYLQYKSGNEIAAEKVFFTGNDVIDTAYYILNWGSYHTLITEIIPALENFANINLILPSKGKIRTLLLEYIKLLNITDINFIAPENIREVRELKLLPIEITYSREALINLRWLLKYRGLNTPKYNFKKIILVNETDNIIPEEIFDFLKEQKFSVFILENTPTQHLINLIGGADQVITTNKIGLVHTIYCKNNCRIMDITDHDSNMGYKYVNNITSLLSPKVSLLYERLTIEELHLFNKKFNQFFAT